MSVLVSDTSVLIDLERGALLESAFRLASGFAVPDLLYEREIKPYNGAQLIALGLRVEELEPEAVTRAQQYRHGCPALTTADSFALALAQARAWTLLTGDGPLRALAATERVDCHGLLWLLDQMEQDALASLRQLYEGLGLIVAHQRTRLPADEVRARLTRYGAALGLSP